MLNERPSNVKTKGSPVKMKILNVNCKSNTAAISRFKKHRLLFNLLRSPKIHQANVASDSNTGKRIINPLPPITILNPAPTHNYRLIVEQLVASPAAVGRDV